MAKKGERDPKRERFWRAAMQRRQNCGLTTKEFCRQEGLSQASYYAWRRELARRDQESPPPQEPMATRAAYAKATSAAVSPALFRELAILSEPAHAASPGLEITLPDGCQVRVAAAVDRTLLADVLWALEARRC